VKRSDGPPRSTDARPQPGRIRAVFLAVLVHGAFFALIVFGVRWQTAPPAPLQAELWAKLPPAVAKAPEQAKPEPPAPEKAEPPKPEPPAPKPPEETKPEPAKPDPEIARKLEREKEKREKLEKERVQKQKDEEARRKREHEEAAKKKREDEKQRQEEERAKREAEKAREAALAARAARASEVTGYIERIKAKIRGRANVPDTVTGNPEVQVSIRVLPGGEVLDIQITKRSANPTYDAAIERAIRSAQPLPVPPADSELFPQFRNLNLNFRHER
jgi:colicin import membrane protein